MVKGLVVFTVAHITAAATFPFRGLGLQLPSLGIGVVFDEGLLRNSSSNTTDNPRDLTFLEGYDCGTCGSIRGVGGAV